VNRFFETAEECRKVETRWSEEGKKILLSGTSDWLQLRRAEHLTRSRCLPHEGMQFVNARLVS
jgi:hypothetical protein